MRQWSSFLHRWRFLFVVCALTYVLVLYLPKNPADGDFTQNVGEEIPEEIPAVDGGPVHRGKRVESVKKPIQQKEKEEVDEWEYEFKPVGKEPFYVTEVLTNFGISLKEKMTCKAEKNAEPKILVTINAGHGQENLGGCPEWNCKLTYDRGMLDKADAVLIAHDDAGFKQRPDQYVIYFSQESPKNSGFLPRQGLVLNMTLGFRHDSATSSPYGYTVKLAKRSRPTGNLVNSTLIQGKKKGAAWFVSHCSTNSWREKIIDALQKDFKVDIYGACGPLKCNRGGACESMLDNDYFFYIAFENSICKDYITEKLWSQGYQRDIVPVVMKRKLVEPFVPPNSFIALDDYETTEAMAAHMHYLMKNLTAYEEYFNWRREYKVVFLNGQNHDVLEKPWGFCQVEEFLYKFKDIQRLDRLERRVRVTYKTGAKSGRVMRLLWVLVVLLVGGVKTTLRLKRQQTDDQWYWMNRGMIMMGKGLTEILTNQKYDQSDNGFFSQVMEPHDMGNHMEQEKWYKDYYGPHGRRF